jgi:glycosyltransferase involved in cell wall biosynthesis
MAHSHVGPIHFIVRSGDMQASMICTLRNEADSIDEFLRSIEQQTRIPDELIIVDGGSNDGTIDTIQQFTKSNKLNIRLIVEPGCNIAQGRNIAVKNAVFCVIASTDAGCTLEKDWFENITRPFSEDSTVDVVAGWYEPDARSDFERVSAAWEFYRKERVIKNPGVFLPSGRSIAFKKSCWEAVGGYPEHLATAEDTLFDLRLKEKGFKFMFAPDAVVHWRVRPTLGSLYKKVFLYRKGDGQARLFMAKQWGTRMAVYFGGVALLLLSFILPILLWILLFGIAVYFLLPSIIVYRRTGIAASFIYMPSILVTQDVAAIGGFFVGLFSRKPTNPR